MKPIDELKRRLLEIAHLSSALALLHWDQEVHMPKKGGASRALVIAELTGLIHQKLVALDVDRVLTKLQLAVKKGTLKGKDKVIVLETARTFERERKLPEAFVRDMAETISKAQSVWATARAQNNFTLFRPWLEKIVALKRKEATYVGYRASPYDALLDAFEPDMTTQEAARILHDLKDFLVSFLKELQSRPQAAKQRLSLKATFPIAEQKKFNAVLASEIGFDLAAGVIEESTHPFTTNFHPHDVRFTTRYRTDDIIHAIGSTIHEAGHGLYEQGLPAEHFGTPLAEAVSLGVHESQSRMWENMIGKSKPFWRYFYPKLKKQFPEAFGKITLEDFYHAINRVTPSLIRTEADEVTYNLHIIIRFEIEKELIEGSIAVRDVPLIWQSKVKEYLGISVKDDAHGALQDVHWSAGLFGYFPTYTFGNLYAAQFFAAMERELPVTALLAKGTFGPVREWLRKHIHSHGKRYTAGALVKKVTGEPLNSRYFADYLKKKYRDIKK
ncbi:MAG: carboxypeptidase M32 [Candidatus Pacebacteria bacterium]|jgi:carboxypeptidase Taq|nr:carboxypeptidase M32 [Candidatus Paceibacterota bacterium]